MLFKVPFLISFPPWLGTAIVFGCSLCWYWKCDPFERTRTQPLFFSSLSNSLKVIRDFLLSLVLLYTYYTYLSTLFANFFKYILLAHALRRGLFCWRRPCDGKLQSLYLERMAAVRQAVLHPAKVPISADTYQASAEKGCVSCLTITEKDGALYPRGPCAGMDICANYQNDMGKLFPLR